MVNPEFLSGEASASPAVGALLDGARRLDALGFGAGSLSARNGSRLTTHADAPLGMLREQDFVEVADYDPHLDRVLCIGRRAPHAHAGMHALMVRAKREVGCVVMVEAPDGVRATLAEAKAGRTQLALAMGALEALRGRDAVALGRSIVVTGRFPEEAVERAAMLLEGGQ